MLELQVRNTSRAMPCFIIAAPSLNKSVAFRSTANTDMLLQNIWNENLRYLKAKDVSVTLCHHEHF